MHMPESMCMYHVMGNFVIIMNDHKNDNCSNLFCQKMARAQEERHGTEPIKLYANAPAGCNVELEERERFRKNPG